MEVNYRRARLGDIIKYAFGGFGSNIAYLLVMSYLTFYYTDIFGISSVAVASLMLVSRLIDAFTDPIMGLISDNTKSKWGKYRPYLLFGAPALGLCVFLLFTAPNLSPTMKLVYVYTVYITYSLVSTAVNIPYHALRPLMSEDPQQRMVIVTWSTGFNIIAQMIILVLTMPMVNFFGGGKQGWAIYGIFAATLTVTAFWLCAWGGKNHDKAVEKQQESKFDLKKSMTLLTQNKPVAMLMIALGTDVLANAAGGAVNVYYFKYVLGRENLVATASLALVVGSILAFPCFPFVTKKFGKKKVFWFSSLFSAIPLLVLWIHPQSPDIVLLGAIFFLGFVSKIPSVLAWAMLPECIDYAEWKCGIKGNGFLSSALTFTNKCGGAIGASAASFALGAVGFVANQAQTEIVLSMIVFLKFGLPVFGYAASLISMYFYDITDEKYAQIRADLNKRNEGGTV